MTSLTSDKYLLFLSIDVTAGVPQLKLSATRSAHYIYIYLHIHSYTPLISVGSNKDRALNLIWDCGGILSQDIQVCNKCGIIFDLEYRPNKDCPLCHSGEYVNLRQNNQ
jgi:hypothetical protein